MIAVSVKPCIVNVLHIPFQNTPLPGAFDIYFTFLVILPDAGAISTSAEFLFISLYLLTMLMDQVDTLHVARYWSEVLRSTIMTHPG